MPLDHENIVEALHLLGKLADGVERNIVELVLAGAEGDFAAGGDGVAGADGFDLGVVAVGAVGGLGGRAAQVGVRGARLAVGTADGLVPLGGGIGGGDVAGVERGLDGGGDFHLAFFAAL